MAKPIVALVGRPNVGKSALFNRIIGERRALVHEIPGVTRDPLYAPAEWAGREVVWVDTGGMAEGGIELAEEVREQAEAALAGADAVVMVVDVQEGLHPLDQEVAERLRRSGKPVVLAVNKADNATRARAAVEFYRLGLGEPVPVSALHGLGVGDLLDRVVSSLPPPTREGEQIPEQQVRVAIVGRPNVGKSSLVNALLGEKRLLVTERPGTTRDAVDCSLRRGDKTYLLVDTAGVRRVGRLAPGLERYAVLRALRAVDRAEVAVLVADAGQGVVRQDQRLASYVVEVGRALVIALNKWDLIPGPVSQAAMAQALAALSFAAYAPVCAVSARTGRGLKRLLEAVDTAAAAYRRRVSPSALNRLLHDIQARAPVPGGARLHALRQVDACPPTFVVAADDPEAVPGSYRRYLESRLREAFDWQGTPLRVWWRKGAD